MLEFCETAKPKPKDGSFYSRFVDDPFYAYEDSSRRDDRNVLALIAAEFSWEVHGYSLANLLCIDVATMLDEKFTVAQNLTYNT
jgi:hypothetical protein